MKIIFLDIDGVLNHQDWYKRRHNTISQEEIASKYPFYEFDPVSVANLNLIIDETGAKVVISSTWRHGRSVEDLQGLLNQVGFIGDVIDKTPNIWAKLNVEDSGYTVPRGCAIDWWLKEKGDFQRINWSQEVQQEYIEHSIVKNYVILDDDSDMLYGQREHFIKTSNSHGLTKELTETAIKVLNKSVINLYYDN